MTVHLIDDDRDVLAALHSLLQRLPCRVVTHGRAEDFLASYDVTKPACLVLDIMLPGINGLDLLQQLARSGRMLPTIVLSAHSDIERVVTAVQRGAIGFEKKPPDPRRLLTKVEQMLTVAPTMAGERREIAAIGEALATLTPREHEAFALLARGASTKQVARELVTSIRTAHIHRTNVFRKLRVDNSVQLASLAAKAAAAGLAPPLGRMFDGSDA